MLFNKPVTHSLEEELQEFKLLQEEAPSASPPQVREPDEKGGDYAGPAGDKADPEEKGYVVDVNDKAAGPRYNVVSRPDGKFTAPAKAEDEETGEPVVEGKKLPAFLAKKLKVEQSAQQEQAIAEAEAARAEVVTRAQQVIEAYYSSDEQLTPDELRVVIEAYSVVTDAYDTMLEEVTTQLESIVEAAGESHDDKDEDEDEDEDKEPKEDEVDHVYKDGEIEHEPKGKKASADAACESVTPVITRARRVLAESGGNDLNEIVADLRSLEESLNVESPKAAALDRHAKVVEGFESLGNICDAVVGQIDEILRTEAGVAEGEDYEVSDNDDRVQVATFIASIAESAEEQLSLLAQGVIDATTATENLARCQYDLERAKEHMKTIAA